MYDKKYHSKDISSLNFLVTGGAGFIGSNIVEYLLKNGAKKVRVLDNFATGFFENISAFMDNPAFELVVGDIRDFETCKNVANDIDYITHQAALGSVPRSIDDPITNNEVNVNGFLNILYAAKETKSVKRIIYAASSSTYGDNSDLIKTENNIGKPLSPYAVSKYVNELYADVFAKTYGMETIGLRYFNVYGPRQSPKGAYAAVVPLFIDAITNSVAPTIHGDGEQTRDFTFVENAVQANIKAFFIENSEAINQVYNIACGEKTSLNQLLEKINYFSQKNIKGIHTESRTGDIKNSWADISKATKFLGYDPEFKLDKGIEKIINQ